MIVFVIAITSRERRCDAWVAEMSRYAWRAAANIIIWQAPESRGRMPPPPQRVRWCVCESPRCADMCVRQFMLTVLPRERGSIIANQDCRPAVDAAC